MVATGRNQLAMARVMPARNWRGIWLRRGRSKRGLLLFLRERLTASSVKKTMGISDESMVLCPQLLG